MRIRSLTSAAVASLAVIVAQAAPAFAYMEDAGEEAGPGLTVMQTLTYFFLIPVSISVTLWFLWALPKWRRDAKPVTGDNWDPKP